MQKFCLSYSKDVRSSVGVDVMLWYCVRTMQARIMKSSLSAHQNYSQPYENRSSVFRSSIFYLLKLGSLFSGLPIFGSAFLAHPTAH